MPSRQSYEILEGFKRPPQVIRRYVLLGAGALILLIAVLSSFYTVAPEEEAIVLRFGRHIVTTGPGLHFKLPFGIDTTLKVPVTEIRAVYFGIDAEPRAAARGRTVRSAPSLSRQEEETRLMLTGDLNIASVGFVVQYRIQNAEQWQFKVRDQNKAIQDVGQSVMREVVGDHTVTEVLTEKRSEIELQVRDQLQKKLDGYELGVKIEAVQLQDVTPPGPVQASFNEVNAAQQEKSKLENEANAEYNRAIPKARGEALQVKANAEGVATERVNLAKGDIAQFAALLAAYEKSGELTRRRLYLETLEKVLPKVERIIVVKGGDILKMLPLGREGGGR